MEGRKLEKTKDPGIYRRGGRYVVVYRDPNGSQRKKSAATLAEARNIKAGVRTDISRGEYIPQTKVTLREFFDGWIATYIGRTTRGIRKETLVDYANQMRRHVLPVLGSRRIADITPQDIKQLAKSLEAKGLAPASVRLAIAPLKALLATAFEDGAIRRDPAANVRIAQPKTMEADSIEAHDGEEAKAAKAKALTGPQLAALLAEIPAEWRLFYGFLAQTGLRISEALELRWRDIDFGTNSFKVTRRLYKGRVAPPKSDYGRRSIRLAPATAKALWPMQAGPNDLVFANTKGSYVDQSNVMSRVLKPAAVRAGLGEWIKTDNGRRAESWVGHHTFRHTCATMLFNNGWNAKQVQVWLGHHSPAFTLETYVHLLSEDLPQLPDEWGNTGATRLTERGRNAEEGEAAETAETLALAGVV